MGLLETFSHKAEMLAFRDSVSRSVKAFDILTVPPKLWRNIYLGQVQGPNSISIRLTGGAIRDFFGCDLRGMNLMSLSHGAHMEKINRSYSALAEYGQEFAIKQLTYLPKKNVFVKLECTTVAIWGAKNVQQVVGVLFAEISPTTLPDERFEFVDFPINLPRHEKDRPD